LHISSIKSTLPGFVILGISPKSRNISFSPAIGFEKTELQSGMSNVEMGSDK